jgi:hypothetical protein
MGQASSTHDLVELATRYNVFFYNADLEPGGRIVHHLQHCQSETCGQARAKLRSISGSVTCIENSGRLKNGKVLSLSNFDCARLLNSFR